LTNVSLTFDLKSNLNSLQDYEQYLTENEENLDQLKEIPRNIQEFKDYLLSIEPVLFQNLLKYIDEFNKSYILLSGFKKQAIEKVDKYYKESIENFTLIDEKFNEKKNFEILKICIHGYFFFFKFQKVQFF
jgi:cell division septum initiation protein DivIVA